MDSDARRPRGLAVAVAWRAALIGTLASAAAWLIATTHLYATAVLALLIAAFTTAGLARLIERIAQRGLGLETFPAARLSRERAVEVERRIESLNALLDTVTAALFIVRPDDRILLVNRAARRLTAEPVERLGDMAIIGPSAARELLALPAGARSIVAFADGRRVFASMSQFSSPERERLRLLSLQRIAGELDAVELDAWHEMAHVLAHEMMNSLTPIGSLSESLEPLLRDTLAARASAGSEILDALEAIRRRSAGLIDFVERYRAVADLPHPRAQHVQLEELLGGVSRLLSARLAQKGIVYQADLDPPHLSLHADPQLLEQAVINLLRNAIDAVSGAREPAIQVTCRIGEDQVSIGIADNGCGIPENGRDQVFVPFFTTKPGGSGIGLSLARQIALAHGGRLELSANRPVGSVFTLVLPAARPSIAAQPAAAEQSVPAFGVPAPVNPTSS